MLINDKEQPNLIIKVCEKAEHIRELHHGKVYFKSSGHFRKIDNDYRGDINDGKIPITNIKGLRLNGIEFPPPDTCTFGFESDDNYPMFCASIITEDNLIKKAEQEYQFHPEFIKEISKFGKYVIIIDLDEFMKQVFEYCQKEEFDLEWEKIKYVNINNEYDVSMIKNKELPYEVFFKKDVHYTWQNEWRLVLFNDKLITQGNDYCIIDIGELKHSVEMGIDKLSERIIIK